MSAFAGACSGNTSSARDTTAAAAGAADGAADGAAGGASTSAAASGGIAMASNPNPCGKNSRPCEGSLKLAAGWTGTGAPPRVLPDTITRMIRLLPFRKGWLGAAQTRPGKGSGTVYLSIDAQRDANLFDHVTAERPTMLVALASNDATTAGAEDASFSVKEGARFKHYLIVDPDRFDGTSDGKSRWYVVRFDPANSGSSRVVEEGSDFESCTPAHSWKAVAITDFKGCRTAKLSAEDIALIKSQPADTLRSLLEIPAFKAAGVTVEDLLAIAQDRAGIWLTCGLGCCTVRGGA